MASICVETGANVCFRMAAVFILVCLTLSSSFNGSVLLTIPEAKYYGKTLKEKTIPSFIERMII